MPVIEESSAVAGAQVITRSEELRGLEHEWKRLWQRCRWATPFQSPEWLLPWWDEFGTGELMVIVARENGRVCGLAPLFIATVESEGSSRRELRFLGTGNSDYLDLLAEEEYRKSFVETMWEIVQARSEDWDLCDLQQLRPESPIVASDAKQSTGEMADVCPVLRLPKTISALTKSLPKKIIHDQRYCRRRAQKCGALTFERADSNNFDELFRRLVDLHEQRWQARGKDGVLRDLPARNFQRKAAWRFMRAGVLRLYALRLNGKVVAAYYGFMHGRRAYFYLSGFDPELHLISPGTLVVGHAVEEAVREGAEEFDFLRGSEAYKYAWGAEDRPVYRVTLQHHFASAA
jgi:CelD/BcsL family acetyltransferase involved in cellulose biosynthesis